MILYYSSLMIKEIESRLNENLENNIELFESSMLTLNIKKSNLLHIGNSGEFGAR